MRKKYPILILVALALFFAGYFFFHEAGDRKDFISYQVDLQKQDLQFYWKDDKGQVFKTIGRLKTWLEAKGKRLVFAMNAGMFRADHSPQGLFIRQGRTISPLDTATGQGNFYLKPNGVFLITADRKGGICTTERFVDSGNILYATQSGPMLVVEGKIHPAFKQGSANLNIRNGVGVLPNGHIIFAMSEKEISFYDFAAFFQQLGCRNALYLDGFVSRTYLPEKHWIQTEGNLGVIMAVTEQQQGPGSNGFPK